MSKIIPALLVLAAVAFSTQVGAQEKEQSQKKQTKETSTPDPVEIGQQAPDFEAQTFDDKTVKLSDRFGSDGKPVVLLFSRANW